MFFSQPEEPIHKKVPGSAGKPCILESFVFARGFTIDEAFYNRMPVLADLRELYQR